MEVSFYKSSYSKVKSMYSSMRCVFDWYIFQYLTSMNFWLWGANQNGTPQKLVFDDQTD